MELVLGIDPGAQGAAALLAPRPDGAVPELLDVAPLPGRREAIGRANRRQTVILDGFELVAILRGWERKHDGAILRIVIERVSALPKDRAPQAFAFGRAYGAVRAIAEAHGAEVTTVPVSVWRAVAGVLVPDAERNRDALKRACRARAAEIWPDQADWFKRVKDTDAAEAALIGLSGVK